VSQTTPDEFGLKSGRFGLAPNAFRLDGKTAVVTGASSNIGLSMALGFAQAGADVVMVARGRDRLARAAAAVQDEVPDRRILHCAADVSSADDIINIARFVAEHTKGADVLANNAHSSGRTKMPQGIAALDIPDDIWQENFDTNVMGPFRLVRDLFSGHMRDGRPASVINTLSGSGFLPVPIAASLPYGATKSALWMMTRYLSRHLAPTIRVNAVCPGNVSPTGQPHSETARVMLQEIPMGRVGVPTEITGAAVYLASDAASFTTGEVIICNGGRPW